MSEEERPLEDEVRDLARTVENLEERLRAVESRLVEAGVHLPASPVRPATADAAAGDGEPGLPPATLGRTAPLAGRLLLVMGGAFVLRAVTEAGTVPQDAGVVLGLLYALLWLGVAARVGARGDGVGSAVYGAASALIAFPLIWETSARFEILAPMASAATLAFVGLLGLGLAWRHRLAGLAWAWSLGASVCGLILILPRTPATAHLTTVLLLFGVVTLWIGRVRGWNGPLWVTALVADAALGLLIADTLQAGELSVPPGPAIVLLLAFFSTYVGSITTYLLKGWWRLDAFDLVQSIAALGIGFGGALGVARATVTAPELLGLASLALAVAFYFAAFRVLDRERRRTFYYVTSVALVLVLVGSASVLARPALPWAVLAIATVLLARRFGRATLGLHGALYAVAAAAASGLLGQSALAWLAPATDGWPVPLPESYLALAAAALCAAVPTRSETVFWTRFVVFPQAVLLGVVAWGAGGVAVDGLSKLVPSGPDGTLDPAWLASVRTAVLAGITLASALIARLPRFEPARWFVYPLLVAGGFKLALEDFVHGHPATLAVSFVLYGAVLIAASRLVRKTGAEEQAAEA